MIENVWHCDIASLYPSTILAFDCVPKSDTIGIFKRMVADLRSYRLDAKKGAKLAADPLEHSRLTALQGAFKILINSLCGYLAFPFGHFADFEAAEHVTAIGREILATMRDWLMSQGAQIIELDTDGIYFSPPDGVTIEAFTVDSRPSCQQASKSSSTHNTKPCLATRPRTPHFCWKTDE